MRSLKLFQGVSASFSEFQGFVGSFEELKGDLRNKCIGVYYDDHPHVLVELVYMHHEDGILEF